MTRLSYTIFADAGCTKVSSVANLCGEQADRILRAFRNVNNGVSVSEGQLVCGCRIDRIRSPQASSGPGVRDDG